MPIHLLCNKHEKKNHLELTKLPEDMTNTIQQRYKQRERQRQRKRGQSYRHKQGRTEKQMDIDRYRSQKVQMKEMLSPLNRTWTR